MRFALAALLVLLGLPGTVPATPSAGGFGIGVIAGEPTGVSIKFRSAQGPNGVDAVLAWSFTEGTSFEFHADYLWHNVDLIHEKKGLASLYWGVGGRILVDNGGDDRIGIRIPGGVDYLFESAPVNLFAEIAPILDVTPETDLSFNAGLGIRFWFR